MLIKTKGIVLHKLKYSESSIIARIFTSDLGLISCIASGVRIKNPKYSPILFQQASLVEIVIYHKLNSNLLRLKEIRSDYTYLTIPYDIRKTVIILFLSELLYKCIKEEEVNKPLFEFLITALVNYDRFPPNPDFTLIFLLRIKQYLGFIPRNNFSSENPFFDLIEGEFKNTPPHHPHYAEKDLSSALSVLLKSDLPFGGSSILSQKVRKELLSVLINYFNLHVTNLKNLKSLKVLNEVFG